MRRWLLPLLGLVLGLGGALLLVGTLAAQTATPLPCATACALLRSQPFSVVYDWVPTVLNPDLPDSFRLYQNGAPIGERPYADLTKGTIRFGLVSGLATAGTYTFVVGAVNSGGETLGDPVTVTILKGKPAKPIRGRFE